MVRSEIQRLTQLHEGQFFERKSAFDRTDDKPRQRNPKEIQKDIVETLSAMANADGGELVVGIENYGTITGVPHPEDKVRLFLNAPGNKDLIHPPLRVRVSKVPTDDGLLLLHFQVDWSPEVHQLSDGRYLLRVQDNNVPFPAEKIAALKQAKSEGLYEQQFPVGATMEDMNLLQVREVFDGKAPGSPEQILQKYRLVEERDNRLIPCLAALLLFGKDPLHWHPRCDIDFVRFEGKERKTGAKFNVVKRFHIQKPLSFLIQRAMTDISPFIRERQRLVDLFFTESLEYPTFVWQEAIVNAVAHRDYSILGAPIEVQMYDDRMEIRSPGLPPGNVTMEALNRRERVHLSRNPILVRVLTDLGYMRELGEGIPRMFEVMAREGFYPPEFEMIGDLFFQVTLRNQPVYDQRTTDWLKGYDRLGLTGDQKRLLAYAHAHGSRFTSRDYQELTDLDIYGASNSIKEMVRKGIAKSLKKGGKVYEVLAPQQARRDMPAELAQLVPLFKEKGELSNAQIREALGVSRYTALRYIDDWIKAGMIERTGTKKGTRYRLV